MRRLRGDGRRPWRLPSRPKAGLVADLGRRTESRQQVAELVAAVSSEDLDAPQRRRRSRSCPRRRQQRPNCGWRAVLGGRWLVDLFVDIAPRIPVRDAETLRDHYDGLTGEALADQLV